MPTGAPSALLAPETEQSERIHQLLNRLAQSVVNARAQVSAEVVAAPSFIGNMAALARTAIAAADDAAAAAGILAQVAVQPEAPGVTAQTTPVGEAPSSTAAELNRPANDDTSVSWVLPEPHNQHSASDSNVGAAAASDAIDLAVSEPALPEVTAFAEAPIIAPPVAHVMDIGVPVTPRAVQSEPHDYVSAFADAEAAADDIPLHGPFEYKLVDDGGGAIEHELVVVDACTGQIRPRTSGIVATEPQTLHVQVRDVAGAQLIERLVLPVDFFLIATAHDDETYSTFDLETEPRAANVAEVLVIDELGPVKFDIAAYLTTGPDGVVQLMRLPEQDLAATTTDIVIVDAAPADLAHATNWREIIKAMIAMAPADAVWATAPPQRQRARGIANPFRNAGTSRSAVRLPPADLRLVHIPTRLTTSQLRSASPPVRTA